MRAVGAGFWLTDPQVRWVGWGALAVNVQLYRQAWGAGGLAAVMQSGS